MSRIVVTPDEDDGRTVNEERVHPRSPDGEDVVAEEVVYPTASAHGDAAEAVVEDEF